jgi:hypothetical protein
MNLRKLTEADRPKIDEWIAKDPFHAGKGSSEFFFAPHTDGFAVEDDAGDVIYVRLARALRVNAVFDPAVPERNKETMTLLAQFLKKMAEESAYREVVWTSDNRALRAFGTTIGYTATPDMVMPVEPSEKG